MKIFRPYIIMLIVLSLSACAHQQMPKQPSQPPAKPIPTVRIALVLGGGGSKGIAHIGALEVLEKYNVPVDLVVGSSAGSAIGAFYADGQTTAQMKQKLMPVSKWDILDPSVFDSMQSLVTLKGPVRGKAYEKFLNHNLTAQKIEDLKIPLVIVTTDIGNNELYLIKSGAIAPAVHASSAVPPIFSPVLLYGKTLIDGGVIEPVPVRVAKTFNPQMIIAIDISSPPPKIKLQNMFELLYQANWIYYYELARMQSKLADIDIHPDLDGHGTFDDDKKQHLYAAGQKAAQQQMPRILEKMKELGIKHTQ